MNRFVWLLPPVVGAFAGGIGVVIAVVIALAFFPTAPPLVFLGFMLLVGMAAALGVGLPVRAAVRRMETRR